MTPEKKKELLAIAEASKNIRNISRYYRLLETSPRRELDVLVDALNGGYVSPTPGGDVVSNPNVLPTGRNLYSVNAEATPSESAWEKGVELSNQFINEYHAKYGVYPRKVNMTLWSSAFIET